MCTSVMEQKAKWSNNFHQKCCVETECTCTHACGWYDIRLKSWLCWQCSLVSLLSSLTFREAKNRMLALNLMFKVPDWDATFLRYIDAVGFSFRSLACCKKTWNVYLMLAVWLMRTQVLISWMVWGISCLHYTSHLWCLVFISLLFCAIHYSLL